MKARNLLFGISALTCLCLTLSCTEKDEVKYFQGHSMENVVRIDNIEFLYNDSGENSTALLLEIKYRHCSSEEMEEAWDFYGDTACFAKKSYNPKDPKSTIKFIGSGWIDCRITGIDIITENDFDEVHKAGSSINDICRFQFAQSPMLEWIASGYEGWAPVSSKTTTGLVSEFEFGDMMICNAKPNNNIMILQLSSKPEKPCKLQIQIRTMFGQSFKIETTVG